MKRTLSEFITASPTAYHAVSNLMSELTDAGFTRLFEGDDKTLTHGGKYFITKNLSSLIAFIMPKKSVSGFNIVAAHSDSPCFKLIDNFELGSEKYVRFSTERYGGPVLSTWLDRPLGVAGKLVVEENGSLKSVLVDLERDALVIPNTAPHLNRELNNGYKYSLSGDMFPLFSDGSGRNALMSELRKKAKIAEPATVFGADLSVYSRQTPFIWGSNGEFISAPRLDDLQCVHAAASGFLNCEPTGGAVPVLAIFDNEEVGSSTKQGAAGTFLLDTLRAVAGDRLERVLASSVLVSADNAHAIHPNHPELSNPNARVFIGDGIVLKINSSGSYTTDALSGAIFRAIADKLGVPYQIYHNRADLPGGGTLGAVSSSQVSVISIDIGLAQHAMHSALETAGTEDSVHMENFTRGFYNSNIIITGDGSVKIEVKG